MVLGRFNICGINIFSHFIKCLPKCKSKPVDRQIPPYYDSTQSQNCWKQWSISGGSNTWTSVCLNVFTFGLSTSSDIAHLGTCMGRSLQHEGEGDQDEEGGGEGGDAGDGRRTEALNLWREEGYKCERCFLMLNLQMYLFKCFCELRAQVAQVMTFGCDERVIPAYKSQIQIETYFHWEQWSSGQHRRI